MENFNEEAHSSLTYNDIAPFSLSLPYKSRIILIFVYSLATLFSVVGNMLVILVFLTGQKSRTDLSVYLINLAASDLVMAIFCMPFTFTMTMLRTWIFSEPMCPIVLYMQTVSVTASICTNIAICVDRYKIVINPLKARITKVRPKFVLFVIWLAALSLSSVQLVVGRSVTKEVQPGLNVPGHNVTDCNERWPEPYGVEWRRTYTLFILFTTYLLPLAILTSMYCIIGRRLWQRTVPGNADESRDARQTQSKEKVTLSIID